MGWLQIYINNHSYLITNVTKLDQLSPAAACLKVFAKHIGDKT